MFGLARVIPPAAFVPRTLSALDYSVLVAYFVANLAIGIRWARRQKSCDSYFRGNRRVAWWAAALSFFAAGSSSISFLALPAKTYSGDWGVFGSAPAQSLAGMVAALVFIAIFRRLDSPTVFAFLDRRFGRPVRLLGAGAAVLLKVASRMSVVMLLPALALSTVTGLNVYVCILATGIITILYAVEGGFMAVIWTDVMQVGVALGGMVIATCFLARGVPGGIGGIWHAGHALQKFNIVSWSWDFTHPTIWVFVGMFWATMFTQIADQPFMQRVFSAADDRLARRTMIWGNALGLLSSVLFFFVGTGLYVFYQFHRERLATGLRNDAILPYFIANELPAGVVGLIVAAIFAASMGTLGSTMNSTAAILVNDFFIPWRPAATEPERLRLARLCTLAAGAASTAMAVYLATLTVKSLWDVYLSLIAVIGGGFAGVFALGLLTRRANSPGVIIGLFGSVAITLWADHAHVSEFFQGFVAVASSMVLGYAASLIFAGRVPVKDQTGLTLWTLQPSTSFRTARHRPLPTKPAVVD